ncbi:hypothetical protein V2J09_019655 [Rumex salicifolius]
MPPPYTIILLLLILINGAVGQSPASRLTGAASRDLARHRFISQQPRQRRRGWGPGTELKPSRAANDSIRLRLFSAADFGVGEYLAEVEIGTPTRRFRLFADTGSDLTWVKCAYRSRSRRERIKRDARIFRADRSGSFKTVPCGSRVCSHELADLFSLTTCPLPSAPCLYNYSYQSNSLVAFGLFGKETITLPLGNHRKLKLSNIIGCTESIQGNTIMNGADGVLGLSYSNQSFAYRAATKYGGGKFSYCLVDHLSTANVTGFLVFGDHGKRATIVGNIRYTRLFLQAIVGFYTVGIKGISVGGSMLIIPAEVWDVSGPGGTILDSGTSLTVLATPAYTAVSDALSKALMPRYPSLESEVLPFSYCFNSTGFDESLVPRLVIHFSDGARFKPHVKSYIIDVMPNVKCVGILEGSGMPYLSILGNILQQNYLWEYDLYNEKLGFGASSCTSYLQSIQFNAYVLDQTIATVWAKSCKKVYRLQQSDDSSTIQSSAMEGERSISEADTKKSFWKEA